MELWIRSQDKNSLIKVNNIYSDVLPEDGYYKIFNMLDEDILGKYLTKERALEVLDEIQHLLIPKGIIKFNALLKEEDMKTLKERFDNNYVIFNKNVELLQQYETLVYEMPKE